MVFLVSNPFPALKKEWINLEKDDVWWDVEKREEWANGKIVGKKKSNKCKLNDVLSKISKKKA